ncbi:flavodoxin [Ruminococcus sp.]|uniref:flavodoxin n=1 Tax=Ruminococcus sp. TaxID=41978 RepID=UPI002873DB30|nr:flavodoxin [Ruminococcus sp.]
MKRIIALLTVIVFMMTFVACSSNSSDNMTASNENETSVQTDATKENPTVSEKDTETDSETPAEDSTVDSNTLVVYFSATGTTKGVAEQIAAVTGADTYEILAAQPYSEADLDWNDSNSRTTIEQNDKTVRPEIGSEQITFDGYSTIYIGYPIWWGEEPRIMDTFVESYDFTGKTVIPFCTSGGSGIGSSGDNLEANAGSGRWLEGDRLSASSDIAGWINGLDL